MTEFEMTTWAGISAVTTAVVGFLKSRLPWFDGKEQVTSLVVGLVLAVTSKLCNIGFQDVEWPLLVVAGLGAGVGAQLIHDGITNPLRGKEK